ncbi:hypothetical protein ISO4_00617 [Alcanivorax venustensis ISO4]|uniref:Glycine zipper family protein n=1 Tax=Alloalcanivorax venustensis ISO4 TaxID=1177184 RepID=A0ABS0AFH5_9GAMM|nr:hypothetical protein [Alloalcanivorax venustensis]MBF5052015.1 hypothetical protein [Alloalcanivorax venustensis ISO4]
MSIRQVELQRKPTLSYFHHRALAALLTTACASSKRVVVDKQGIDEAQYQQDLSDCRAIAAGGAIFGDSGTAGRMAGGGAVIGAAGKAQDAEQEKSQVVKNCMRGAGLSGVELKTSGELLRNWVD